MATDRLRIISRESPLAMWQARHVQLRLQQLHPHLKTEIIGISTEADRFLDLSLDKLGGKGAFIKELEQALLDDRADIAVHSMKDVTIELPEGLELAAILAREDIRDVFVAGACPSLDALPAAARVGTSSLRRRCQLKALRPDLDILDIRGNLGTRLKKLDHGDYDALILAAAGMKRLEQADRIREFLPVTTLLPAIGQGALGIETRKGDARVNAIIQPLNDATTSLCVTAERALSRELNGGCHAPVAGLAELDGQRLTLRGLVGSLDGNRILRTELAGDSSNAAGLGQAAGRELISRGAAAILAAATGG